MIKTKRLELRCVEVSDWRDIQAIWIDQKKSEYAQYDNYKDTDDIAVETIKMILVMTLFLMVEYLRRC